MLACLKESEVHAAGKVAAAVCSCENTVDCLTEGDKEECCGDEPREITGIRLGFKLLSWASMDGDASRVDKFDDRCDALVNPSSLILLLCSPAGCTGDGILVGLGLLERSSEDGEDLSMM